MVSTVLLDVQFRQGDVMGSPQTHSTQREVAELPSLSSSSSYISAIFSCSMSSSGAEESCQTFLPFAVRVDYSAGMATCSKLCMLLQAEIGRGVLAILSWCVNLRCSHFMVNGVQCSNEPGLLTAAWACHSTKQAEQTWCCHAWDFIPAGEQPHCCINYVNVKNLRLLSAHQQSFLLHLWIV